MNSVSNYGEYHRKWHLIPDLILHELCKFLNLSELKAFRLVCTQWYFGSRTNVKIQGHLHLHSECPKFSQFANSKKDPGRNYPVKNLKLSICPYNFGCKCQICITHYSKNYKSTLNEIKFRQFDQSTLETIIGKCSSGIKSFDLSFERSRMVIYSDNENHNFQINFENLLLRDEFRILRELRINHATFQLTPDSGINSVLQKLTHLSLSHSCAENDFAANVLKQCSYLRALTIGWGNEMFFQDYDDDSEPIASILDAFRDAKKENEFMAFEELKIDCQTIFPFINVGVHTLQIIFQKIQTLNLKLKVLHAPLGLELNRQENSAFFNVLQQVLKSQKDHLVSLELPHILWTWSNSETQLEYFPPMKNLKKLYTSVLFKLPILELHNKLPVLKSLTMCFIKQLPLRRLSLEERNEMAFNTLSEFEIQLTQNQNISPCETVTDLHLIYALKNVDVLMGFSKVFPNVQFLTIDLKSEDLHKLWTTWPRLQELTLLVQYKEMDGLLIEQMINARSKPEMELSKFHSGLIGMPEKECESLIESAVSFMSLKTENYDFNLPSIRDLQELKKLSLKCEMACNIALMLGILPMKNLREVEMTDCNITIDCVQHVLSCHPNINRWKFKGVCYLDFDPHRVRFTNESVNWTISSTNDVKLQPTYKYRCLEFRMLRGHYKHYKTRLRSVNNYGRGKCLHWTLYSFRRPSPYIMSLFELL